MKTKIVYKDYVTDILDSTGIAYRQGQRKTGHWIFLPKSNLKSWTQEECDIIENTIVSNPKLGFVYKLVKSDWTDYTVTRGKGLRIYIK